MKYTLALDQGTTSSRAILFDREGRQAASAQREFRQIFPRPGWVEHDAEEIWRTQLLVAREVLEKAAIGPSQVAAIGITNQRETTVVWDRATGVPVYNAIVWQDRRTADRCAELRATTAGAAVTRQTGLQIDPYFSATKLEWILENVPGAHERAQAGELAFGTVDSWLVWKLTGGRVHVTDASNASRTLLFDLRGGDWSPGLLGTFGVPAAVLPDIVASSGLVGETDPEILGAPVAIGGIAGDQQSALFGQMCVQPGMAKNTYGTGCFLLLNTGTRPVRSDNGLLTTVAWRIGSETTFALEGSVFVGGAVIQWLRDGLGLIASSADVEALARSVPDTGGVYCVPAFTGLGAPHWDPYARGTLVGLTRGTTSAHLARAALESIGYQVADVVDAMVADSGLDLGELRVDGGAAANDLLLQFQSDLLGTTVVRPEGLETTALGAAYMAGLAAGVWSGVSELAERWAVDSRFEPAAARADISRRRSGWRRALERAAGWELPDAP